MASHPEERPIHLANVFTPLHAHAKDEEDARWSAPAEHAHAVMDRVENILVKELPRVADTIGAVVRGLETRLEEAHREIVRLREAQQAAERAHAEDANRLSEMDRLRRENAELSAKVAQIEELKRALARL